MSQITEAHHEDEIRRCWPVFHELRPHIVDEHEFVARWQRQRADGYAMAYILRDEKVAAAAGFRIMNTMAWGKIIYLDDLGALPSQRGKGFGSMLLTWLQEKARSEGCDAVHLDTGYQRHAAHKAYLRNGFQLRCHHLAWMVCGD